VEDDFIGPGGNGDDIGERGNEGVRRNEGDSKAQKADFFPKSGNVGDAGNSRVDGSKRRFDKRTKETIRGSLEPKINFYKSYGFPHGMDAEGMAHAPFGLKQNGQPYKKEKKAEPKAENLGFIVEEPKKNKESEGEAFPRQLIEKALSLPLTILLSIEAQSLAERYGQPSLEPSKSEIAEHCKALSEVLEVFLPDDFSLRPEYLAVLGLTMAQFKFFLARNGANEA